VSPKLSSLAYDEKEFENDQYDGCEPGLKLIKTHQTEASSDQQAPIRAAQISGRITISF